MKLTFLIPLAGVATGIYISDLLSANLIFPSLLLIAGFLVWIIINYLSKDPLKGVKYASFHGIWIFLIFAGLGSFDFNFRSVPYVANDIEGEKMHFTGKVKDVNVLSGGERFKINILSITDSKGNKIPCSNVNFYLITDGYSAEKGEILSFSGTPRKINDKSIGKQLKHQGIEYTVNAKCSQISSQRRPPSLTIWLDDFKDKMIIRLENSSLSRQASEFIISILFGERSFINADTRQTLNSTGMAHVLALSGLHVGILISILYVVLFPLSLAGFHKTKKFTIIILLWVFVLMTGMAPSTMRAALMASFLIVASLLELKNSSFNSLLGAILIILLADPLSLWNIGLQLSFICVASILLFTNKLNPIDQRKHHGLYTSVNMILITLVATLSSWVVISYYFESVSPSFLLPNLLLLPLLPILIGIAVIYIIFLNFNIDPHFVAMTIDRIYIFIIKTAEVLGFNGESMLELKVPGTTVILWLVALGLCAYILYSGHRKRKIIATAGAFTLMVLSLTSIFILAEESNDSLKFQHSFTKIETSFKIKGKLQTIQFPRRNISDISTDKCSLLAVDRKIHPDSLFSFKKKEYKEPHFLIVGPDADNDQISGLISEIPFHRVILHAGFGKKKKAELLSLLEEKYWDKIYSLRDNGSLELDL